MKPETALLCLILGYLTGLLYFSHLLLSLLKSLSQKKPRMNYWKRYLAILFIIVPGTLLCKESFALFPLGFFLSRLTLTLTVLRIGRVWTLKRGSS